MSHAVIEIGAILVGTQGVDECLRSAKQAERGGFGSLWLGEAYYEFRRAGLEARSSTSIAALLGSITTKPKIGLGVVNPYTRHPVVLAMEAATLDEISGKRLILGLGTARTVLRHIGLETIDQIKPIPTMREAVLLIKQILAGHEVRFKGDIFTADVPRLITPPLYRSDLPIYLGPTAPKLMRLCGELCDGIITSSLTTPAWISYAVSEVRKGAERVKRDLSKFDVAGTLICSIDDDGDKARNQARRLVATYLGMKVINVGETGIRQLEISGIHQEEVRPIATALASSDIDTATAALNDDLLQRAAPLVGTPEECVKALKEFANAGLKQAVLSIQGNFSQSVDLIARRIIPVVSRDT